MGAINSKFSVLISAFIVAIVGLALIPAVADEVFSNQNAFAVLNETVDVSSGMSQGGEFDGTTTFEFAQDFVRGVQTVNWNSSKTLVVGTDVIPVLDVNPATFTIANTSTTRNLYQAGAGNTSLNTTTFNYTHGDNFVRNAASRTLLGLVVLFFALGILLFAAKDILRDRFGLF